VCVFVLFASVRMMGRGNPNPCKNGAQTNKADEQSSQQVAEIKVGI
jgi:hypothetical protein